MLLELVQLVLQYLTKKLFNFQKKRSARKERPNEETLRFSRFYPMIEVPFSCLPSYSSCIYKQSSIVEAGLGIASGFPVKYFGF